MSALGPLRYALLGLVAACGGCGTNVEACSADAQCENGRCESLGYCSVPDDNCPSGRRWASTAADSLRDECVDGSPASTGGSSSTTTTTTTTTMPGTTTMTAGSSTTAITTGASTGVGSTGPALDPDLIAWYRLDGPDFAGGVLDSTDNALHGACGNALCPAATATALGGGAAFDGVDDLVDVPYDPRFATTTEFSVMVWARPTLPDVDTSFSAFAKPVVPTSQNSWQLEYRGDGLGGFETRLVTFGQVGFGTIAVPTTAPSQWTHLAGTWDGAMVRLFIDGLEVGAAPQAQIDFDQQGLVIGGDRNSGNPIWHFPGDLDDARLYGRALDPAEIAAIAAVSP